MKSLHVMLLETPCRGLGRLIDRSPGYYTRIIHLNFRPRVSSRRSPIARSRWASSQAAGIGTPPRYGLMTGTWPFTPTGARSTNATWQRGDEPLPLVGRVIIPPATNEMSLSRDVLACLLAKEEAP